MLGREEAILMLLKRWFCCLGGVRLSSWLQLVPAEPPSNRRDARGLVGHWIQQRDSRQPIGPARGGGAVKSLPSHQGKTLGEHSLL